VIAERLPGEMTALLATSEAWTCAALGDYDQMTPYLCGQTPRFWGLLAARRGRQRMPPRPRSVDLPWPAAGACVARVTVGTGRAGGGMPATGRETES